MVGRTILALCVLAAVAHADNRHLVEARAALDAVRYDEARAQLVAALEQGNNSPAEVAEIYQLSASTALVLGQRESAERYFRRWLAIDPSAQLPDSVAPKLREPFVAAQAYMAARGHLSVMIEHRGDAIDVLVAADPLAMVGAVRAGDEKVALGADRRAKLHGNAERVAVLDEFGNHLIELPVPPAEPAAAPPEPTPVPAPHEPAAPGPGLMHQPLAWAVPAVVLAGVGVGFELAARDADDQLSNVLANSGQHFYGDADALRSRRDRDAIIADVAFGTSAACVAVAVIVYAIRPSSRVTAVGNGVAIRW
jgi:hypothetical protein